MNNLDKIEVKIFKGYWTISDVKTAPDYLFIFGDNDIKKGKKGQAIIRDEKNTFGIPTKKKPNYELSSYYYDEEYEINILKINFAFSKLDTIIKSKKYKGIILPEDGIGSGLAKLKENAPKTLEYINNKIKLLNY